MRYSAIIFFLAILFSSCNILQPESAPIKLEGQKWKLVSIDHKKIKSDDAYLQFNDGKVGGKAFCNSINSEFELVGDNQISFDHFLSTKMYCEGVMDLESLMLTNLELVKRYEIKNRMLYLSDADKVIMIFKK